MFTVVGSKLKPEAGRNFDNILLKTQKDPATYSILMCKNDRTENNRLANKMKGE